MLSTRSRSATPLPPVSGDPSESYKLPIAELRELFQLVAKDGQMISINELGQLFKMVGMQTNEAELKEFIKEVDVDGNGTIEFEEFVAVMSRKVTTTVYAPEQIKHAFSVFRKELPPGRIQISDLQKALTHYGTHKCTIAEAAMLTSTLGLPPTAVLDYEDFVNYICKD